MVHACGPSIWEAEAGLLQVQGQLSLHCGFKNDLGHKVRLCFRTHTCMHACTHSLEHTEFCTITKKTKRMSPGVPRQVPHLASEPSEPPLLQEVRRLKGKRGTVQVQASPTHLLPAPGEAASKAKSLLFPSALHCLG